MLCRQRAMRVMLAALIGLVAVAGACASDGVPEVPVGADGTRDPELVAGRTVYIARCANCHGNDGSGGRGTEMSGGRMLDVYPVIEDQISVVADGVRTMPAFAEALDPAEIVAVVKYTREVL